MSRSPFTAVPSCPTYPYVSAILALSTRATVPKRTGLTETCLCSKQRRGFERKPGCLAITYNFPCFLGIDRRRHSRSMGRIFPLLNSSPSAPRGLSNPRTRTRIDGHGRGSTIGALACVLERRLCVLGRICSERGLLPARPRPRRCCNAFCPASEIGSIGLAECERQPLGSACDTPA